MPFRSSRSPGFLGHARWMGASAAPWLSSLTVGCWRRRRCRRISNCRTVGVGPGARRDLAYAKRESVYVQGFDFRLERLARDAELRRRSRGAGDPSARCGERALDQFLLALGERGRGILGMYCALEGV